MLPVLAGTGGAQAGEILAIRPSEPALAESPGRYHKQKLPNSPGEKNGTSVKYAVGGGSSEIVAAGNSPMRPRQSKSGSSRSQPTAEERSDTWRHPASS